MRTRVLYLASDNDSALQDVRRAVKGARFELIERDAAAPDPVSLVRATTPGIIVLPLRRLENLNGTSPTLKLAKQLAEMPFAPKVVVAVAPSGLPKVLQALKIGISGMIGANATPEEILERLVLIEQQPRDRPPLRRHPRFSSRLACWYRSDPSNLLMRLLAPWRPATAVDIGIGGIGIMASEPLARGKSLVIRFGLESNDKPISVGATVVWARDGQAAQGRRYGLQFLDIGESEQSVLTEYIQRRLAAG